MADMIISLLERIWKQSIRIDYANGLILSESSLMAAFYHHARLALETESGGLSVYTEPTFWWNDGPAQGSDQGRSRLCKPDVLIGTNLAGEKGRAVAVIEFEYMPWYRPDYRGDLGKLARIASSTKSYGATINVERGTEHVEDDDLYRNHLSVDEETVLVYAVIGRRDCDACMRLPNDTLQLPRHRFAHFTGSVRKGTEPEFETIRDE